ncbi:MAG: DUF1365 domain-containing protein [Planctomycetaceae bacterium]
MHSCIYEGRVRHRRFGNPAHTFTASLFLMYLDLDELPRILDDFWLWSASKPALARFRRNDHFGDPDRPLDECVQDLVHERLGFRPSGRICLLTQLRWLGYVMNPVSFFYCWNTTGTQVDAVVAEVTNTPWNERHCYVIDGRPFTADGRQTPGSRPSVIRHRHDKQFHVSPFLPMNLNYQWRIRTPGRTLAVHLEDLDVSGKRIFDASLLLARREISSAGLARLVLRYPAISMQTTLRIYWQAARLWWKRAAFHPHPRNAKIEHRGSETETLGARQSSLPMK